MFNRVVIKASHERAVVISQHIKGKHSRLSDGLVTVELIDLSEGDWEQLERFEDLDAEGVFALISQFIPDTNEETA